jgi:non-homologous end joining protein Ku
MARALWKGAISYGLIYVPVELRSEMRHPDSDKTFSEELLH